MRNEARVPQWGSGFFFWGRAPAHCLAAILTVAPAPVTPAPSRPECCHTSISMTIALDGLCTMTSVVPSAIGLLSLSQ